MTEAEDATAEFVRDYADFLESHIERWTVTTEGTLVRESGVTTIRVNPRQLCRLRRMRTELRYSGTAKPSLLALAMNSRQKRSLMLAFWN